MELKSFSEAVRAVTSLDDPDIRVKINHKLSSKDIRVIMQFTPYLLVTTSCSEAPDSKL